MSRVRLPVMVALVCALVVVPAASAVAQEVPDIATDTLTLRPEGGAATKLRWEEGREYAPVEATILLRNPANRKTTVVLAAWLNDGKPLAITRVRGPRIDLNATTRGGVDRLDNGGRFDLVPKSVTPVRLTFAHLGQGSATAGRLILTGPGVPKAVTIPIMIEKPTPLWYLWLPLLGGIGLSGLITLIRWLTLRGVHSNLPPRPAWSFKDGWASNVVVIGAVAASVLGAISLLGTPTFGDFSIAKFVSLNLVFGGLVFVAPLIYSALKRTVPEGSRTRTVGTVTGFLMACAATLWAAFGQLLTLFVLLQASPHTRPELVFLTILLFLAAVFVGLYAWRTIGWTVHGVEEAEAEPTEEQVERTKSRLADAGVEGAPILVVPPAAERRVTLL
jgi:hypothetical protein